MTGIPVLETERLRLRAPAARDAEGFIAFFGSDRTEHVGGRRDRAQAWRLFGLEIGHWTLRGYGMWAVTMRGDDRCLGLVGCWEPEGWPERELGWFVWPEAEGRGIAHEAALAARDCAYQRFGWTTAVSYIDAPNHRSRRLAERLGARVEAGAPTPNGDEAILVYRHPPRETLA